MLLNNNSSFLYDDDANRDNISDKSCFFFLPSSMNLLVKPLTGILGLVLLLAGIAGFFTQGMLFIFEVDTMHNIVHVVSGAIGLFAFNSSQSASRNFLIIFGLIYGLVTVLGFAMGGDIFGLLHVNGADNYLHLAIAASSLVVGFGSGK